MKLVFVLLMFFSFPCLAEDPPRPTRRDLPYRIQKDLDDWMIYRDSVDAKRFYVLPKHIYIRSQRLVPQGMAAKDCGLVQEFSETLHNIIRTQNQLSQLDQNYAKQLRQIVELEISVKAEEAALGKVEEAQREKAEKAIEEKKKRLDAVKVELEKYKTNPRSNATANQLVDSVSERLQWIETNKDILFQTAGQLEAEFRIPVFNPKDLQWKKAQGFQDDDIVEAIPIVELRLSPSPDDKQQEGSLGGAKLELDLSPFRPIWGIREQKPAIREDENGIDRDSFFRLAKSTLPKQFGFHRWQTLKNYCSFLTENHTPGKPVVLDESAAEAFRVEVGVPIIQDLDFRRPPGSLLVELTKKIKPAELEGFRKFKKEESPIDAWATEDPGHPLRFSGEKRYAIDRQNIQVIFEVKEKP